MRRGDCAPFDGFVAKYMATVSSMYFGYPQAHEDDAERAVRAGLSWIAAVAGLKTHARCNPCRDCDRGRRGRRPDRDGCGSGQAVVGGTPNLAARLQAWPSRTWWSLPKHAKILGNLFELQDLGAREVKGIASPVQAWVARGGVQWKAASRRCHASGLTALVGREEENGNCCCGAGLKAKNGEGQVVLLPARPGSESHGSPPR